MRPDLGGDLRILTFSFEMAVCQAKMGARLGPADFGRTLRPHAASRLLLVCSQLTSCRCQRQRYKSYRLGHGIAACDLREQRLQDALPFLLESCIGNGFPCPSIPVGSVIPVTLFPVQVGMNPGTGSALIRLRALVSSRPIPFCVPPQPSQSLREFVRRIGSPERLVELFEDHLLRTIFYSHRPK